MTESGRLLNYLVSLKQNNIDLPPKINIVEQPVWEHEKQAEKLIEKSCFDSHVPKKNLSVPKFDSHVINVEEIKETTKKLKKTKSVFKM